MSIVLDYRAFISTSQDIEYTTDHLLIAKVAKNGLIKVPINFS